MSDVHHTVGGQPLNVGSWEGKGCISVPTECSLRLV